MSTYRQRVHALATEIGATVHVDDNRLLGHFEVDVEAPAGQVWSCTGDIHALVASDQRGPWSKVPLWKDLHERMEHGLQPCEVVDCDWCGDNELQENSQETRGETR